MSQFQFFMPIAKVDKAEDGTCIVSGYASTPTKDSDGEIVTLAAIKKALPDYMQWRNIREMHQLKAVGKAQSANIDTKGLWLSAKIVDPIAVKKCIDEVYQGFSIGGRKLVTEGNKITEIEMTEISVVDRPANPDARFALAKSAKALAEEPGYLLEAQPKRSAEAKALAKMAKIVGSLAKANPPAILEKAEPSPKDNAEQNNKAAGEGEKCKEHGVEDCEECAKVKKAEADAAKEPAAKASKPSKLARQLEKSMRFQLLDVTGKDFLTLKPNKEAAPVIEKSMGTNGEAVDLIDADYTYLTSLLGENFDMDKVAQANTGDPIADALASMMKKAATPSKAQRMEMAVGDIKKARKACKMAKEAIKEAHKMHKAAYMNKAAKKDAKDKDAEDDGFDHAGAMEKLQKAYGEMDKARTFGKAASGQIAKAAGRSGQRGQETSDGEAGVYEVPAGVKDLSPNALASASPGGGESGGMPPAYPDDGSVYAGKGKTVSDLQKYAKNGQISADVAELIMAKAKSDGELEALRRMPAAGQGNRRPFAFDMTKVMGGTSGGGNSGAADMNKALFDGVDPMALGSGDERAHTEASARVIGNLLTSQQFGKSVFDASFKGAAGGK